MQKILFTSVMMATLLTACSSDDDNNNPVEPIDNLNGKTLVVYFSKTVPDGVDASGKNVMVFTTHEGSGLADAISVIRQQEPQAKVNATGFQTRGASAGSQSNAINEWLKGLGYK